MWASPLPGVLTGLSHRPAPSYLSRGSGWDGFRPSPLTDLTLSETSGSWVCEGAEPAAPGVNGGAWGMLSALSTTFRGTDPVPAAASLDTSCAEKEGGRKE